MIDLHDPNNPEYSEETELNLELVLETLTPEYEEIVQDAIDAEKVKVSLLIKRILLMKSSLNELIETLEQTENTLVLNKLKTIVNY